MKDQISPAKVNEIVEEPVVHEEPDTILRKDEVVEVQVNCIESDEDSGFLNASNVSLNITCDSIDNKNDDDAVNINNNIIEDQQPPTPVWKLKIPLKIKSLNDEQIIQILKSVLDELDTIPEENKKEWVFKNIADGFGKVLPNTLTEIIAGFMFNGDTGKSMDIRPEWLDIEKFRRGQKFARDHISAISYADMLSLFTVFSFQEGLKPIIATGASSTPYTAFKRYLSTATRVENWFSSDPWTPGTAAYNDIKAVRRIHAVVRKRTRDMTNEEFTEKTKIKNPWCPALNMVRRDFESTCPAPAPGQCPYTLINKSVSVNRELNQGEMACTQFAFLGLLILRPKFFGVHDATDDDLEAFCHVWRGLGYLLGIDDDFNFCRGTLEDVRKRSRDFLEIWVKPNFRTVTPEWEHMMRCMIEGVQYYFPGSTYETALLDLCELMNLHMPRLYESLSYPVWIRHSILRLIFNYGYKVPGLYPLLNHRLNQSLEKARKYDEDKHKELQEKSAKTLEACTIKIQKAKTPVQQSSDNNN